MLANRNVNVNVNVNVNACRVVWATLQGSAHFLGQRERQQACQNGESMVAQTNRLKRSLHGMMDELLNQAEKGHLNTEALRVLSKKLKVVHAQSNRARAGHVSRFIINSIAEEPFTANVLAFHDDTIDTLSDPLSIQLIIHAKRAASKGAINASWWTELMEALIPDWASIYWIRERVIVLLMARMHTLEHVEKRLDALRLDPAALFPLKSAGGEPVDPADIGNCSVYDALRADPRFVRWLLKRSATPHTYESAELLSVAVHASLYSGKAEERDEGWCEAVGRLRADT